MNENLKKFLNNFKNCTLDDEDVKQINKTIGLNLNIKSRTISEVWNNLSSEEQNFIDEIFSKKKASHLTQAGYRANVSGYDTDSVKKKLVKESYRDITIIAFEYLCKYGDSKLNFLDLFADGLEGVNVAIKKFCKVDEAVKEAKKAQGKCVNATFPVYASNYIKWYMSEGIREKFSSPLYIPTTFSKQLLKVKRFIDSYNIKYRKMPSNQEIIINCDLVESSISSIITFLSLSDLNKSIIEFKDIEEFEEIEVEENNSLFLQLEDTGELNEDEINFIDIFINSPTQQIACKKTGLSSYSFFKKRDEIFQKVKDLCFKYNLK